MVCTRDMKTFEDMDVSTHVKRTRNVWSSDPWVHGDALTGKSEELIRRRTRLHSLCGLLLLLHREKNSASRPNYATFEGQEKSARPRKRYRSVGRVGACAALWR